MERQGGVVLVLVCSAVATSLLSPRCCHLAAAVTLLLLSIHTSHHTHTLLWCLTCHRELRFSNIPAPKRNRPPVAQRGYLELREGASPDAGADFGPFIVLPINTLSCHFVAQSFLGI